MTETEALVVRTFSGLLEGRPVSPDDDLFSMGADSLSALRAVLELERQLGVSIPQETLIEHRTLRDLAAWLDRALEARP